MSALLDKVFTAIDKDRLPPVCFLSCADRTIAEKTALVCAARYCGTEALDKLPDFFDLLCPIPIDELRSLLSELTKRSLTGGKRCIRIRNAELLSEQEQNLLLKTLEEPPAKTLFLLCGNYAAMLPTVRSRCAVLRLGEANAAETERMLQSEGASARDAALYARVSQSYEQAYALCTDEAARALREGAYEAYLSILEGMLPYPFIQNQKNKKQVPSQIALYWLSFSRDLLACKFGLPMQNTDLQKRLSVYSARFTSERINCMIEMLTTALLRLQTNASSVATLDWLATQMLEDKNKGDK